MVDIYKSKQLPFIELGSYRTELEKDFFMVVNLMRDHPMSFQNYVKNYVAKGTFQGNAKAGSTLNKRLHTLDKLEPITPNNNATSACYVNLTKNESSVSNLSTNAVKELRLTDP